MVMVECEASVTSCYVHVAHVMMVARTPGLQDSSTPGLQESMADSGGRLGKNKENKEKQ